MTNRGTTIDFLPHRALSDADKASSLAVLRAGNPLFRKWAVTFYGLHNKGKQFRREFFKGTLGDESGVCPLIPGDDVAKMKAVAAVEEMLILGHVKLIRRVVGVIYNRLSAYTYLDQEDLLFEGVVAIREAIYNYQDKPGQVTPEFLTYAWKIIRRKVTAVAAKSRDMGGIKDSGIKLLARYFQAKAGLAEAQEFADVIRAGGFTPSEADDISGLLTSFVRPDSRAGAGSSEPITIAELAVEPEAGSNLDRFVIRDAILAANLSEVERELLEGKMSGGPTTRTHRLKGGGQWGFLTQVAARHVNYRGETLTKQGARVILKRAEKKVRVSLSQAGMGPAPISRPIAIAPPVVAVVAPVVAKAAPVKPRPAPVVAKAAPALTMPEPLGLENDLGIPPALLLAFVQRLVAGESRRKLAAELQGLGFKIAVNTLYYRAKSFQARMEAA